jgi:CheY-like chemotaxis protein
LPKAHILLVEDEHFIRLVLSEALLEEGFAVTEAGDGAEAVLALDGEGGFDLLLTDLHMPGQLDGIAVARHARARWAGLPVIFATGRPEALQAFGRLGDREALLRKPFSPSEAVRMVARLLDLPG